tara:strand:+ start:3636 stop:4097 length:462 start_codon:yes stop_codon:yes gene_type:complete
MSSSLVTHQFTKPINLGFSQIIKDVLCDSDGVVSYKISQNTLFLWAHAHITIIKDNVPSDEKYQHIHAFDEVDLVFRMLGPSKFELPPSEFIILTKEEYDAFVQHLMLMGIQMKYCLSGRCTYCSAFFGMLNTPCLQLPYLHPSLQSSYTQKT